MAEIEGRGREKKQTNSETLVRPVCLGGQRQTAAGRVFGGRKDKLRSGESISAKSLGGKQTKSETLVSAAKKNHRWPGEFESEVAKQTLTRSVCSAGKSKLWLGKFEGRENKLTLKLWLAEFVSTAKNKLWLGEFRQLLRLSASSVFSTLDKSEGEATRIRFAGQKRRKTLNKTKHFDHSLFSSLQALSQGSTNKKEKPRKQS